MKKFEAHEFLRKAGLPTAICREFKASELPAMLSYADWLRESGYSVGLRTDTLGELAGTGCPFELFVSNKQLTEIVRKYQNELTYLVYECFSPEYVIVQGVVYLLPTGQALFYVNERDKVTCRAAIEDPYYGSHVRTFVRKSGDSDDHLTKVRAMLLRASRKEQELIGKRIEWTLFGRRGYIFWQANADLLGGV